MDNFQLSKEGATMSLRLTLLLTLFLLISKRWRNPSERPMVKYRRSANQIKRGGHEDSAAIKKFAK